MLLSTCLTPAALTVRKRGGPVPPALSSAYRRGIQAGLYAEDDKDTEQAAL